MDYKKLKAFLKAEKKDNTASSQPRSADHPNGYDKLIGTGGAFYAVPSCAIQEIGYEGEVIEDSRMADYFTKKEALEPIACLRPTMHLYEVIEYRGKTTTYRKLAYELDGEKKSVWVDRRFLDILDSDPTNLRNLTGVWRIERVEKNLVRVKRSSSHFELGKGNVTTWNTVMYCCTANIQNYKFDELRKEEEETSV